MHSQHTLGFNSHPAPGPRLTLHFSPCVFGSVKSPLCCVWAVKHPSEQRLPVRSDCCFNSAALGCLRFDCLSVGLPSSFPPARRGRRHFRGDRRVTGGIAKTQSSPLAAWTPLELQTESILGCLTAEVRGRLGVPFGLGLSPPPGFILSSSSSSCSACLLSCSFCLVSWFWDEDDNNGWRTEKGSHGPHWGRSHYLSRHQHDNDIFSRSVNPVKDTWKASHLVLFCCGTTLFFFFYCMHSPRELKERLLCSDCLITIRAKRESKSHYRLLMRGCCKCGTAV